MDKGEEGCPSPTRGSHTDHRTNQPSVLCEWDVEAEVVGLCSQVAGGLQVDTHLAQVWQTSSLVTVTRHCTLSFTVGQLIKHH